MKILKNVLVFLLVVVAGALVISQFLPDHYRVERSIVIDARPEQIQPWISNLKKWPEWSAWTVAKDASLQYSYEGPEEGAGAVSKWESKKFGQGQMTVVGSDVAKGVTFDLSFEHGKFISRGSLAYAPAGSATKLIWTMEGNLNRNPLNRFFGLIMDKMTGPDFEEGLKNLKAKVEHK
ncbi:MAG: polyketide cyclase [Verrucomicrobia bacterium]|nr:MAG: polyketide cyclase [Verrucomicrobiota bacterium]